MALFFRDVAKYASTTSGTQATIRNHLEYNTFGIVTTADDPTTATVNDGDRPGLEGTGNEFSPQRSYTGREPDTATGLIYYRARWYDPRIGRFISEDPIGFAAGDANLSRYVGNSSPNAVDPSGLDRLLTPNERQAIEYIYKAVMPGIQKSDELRQMLAETLAEVTLLDIDTTPFWVVIPKVSIIDNGYAACTLGESQYYRNVPKADDPGRFALIAHETMHSFHEELMADTTWMFLTGYVGDSFTAWV